jgi:hypothetical protein
MFGTTSCAPMALVVGAFLALTTAALKGREGGPVE